MGELHVDHVGDLHSLEPCKNLLRTDAAINTLGEDKLAGIQFTVRKDKQIQSVKEDI